MDIDDFEKKTSEFLSWLTATGLQLDPKAQIADLRHQARGRGLGMISQQCFFYGVASYWSSIYLLSPCTQYSKDNAATSCQRCVSDPC
jgi:hypothetical protein